MPPEALLAWAQVAQGLLLPVIGAGIVCVGAQIALQQVRIYRLTLARDLFDRRFRVFASARLLTEEAISFRSVTKDALRQYYLGIADAPFLFDADLVAFLDKLGNDASLIGVLAEQKPDEASRQLTDMIEAMRWSRDELVGLFSPFLRLG